jgi:curli biogenesis system outer membrane secretion channel CsgG
MRALALIGAAVLVLAATSPVRAANPSVAVLDFSTKGLTSDWWGNWEPGVAISDLVTANIVNTGKFDVLDRTHVDQTVGEHQLGASGEVDPASAISAGHMVGARYLIIGNVVQFDHTGTSGGGVGGLIPGPLGIVAGGVKQDRVTLNVAVRVVDALTGRIVQSFSDETTDKATSIGGGAFVGLAGGGYENSNFISSAMGHLVNEEAQKIATELDPTKFASGPAAPTVNGHVLGIDGSNVLLNVGTSKGVAVGTYFNVLKVKHLKDPDSGKILTVSETVGTIEVMSVSTDSSVARRASGTAETGDAIQSQ